MLLLTFIRLVGRYTQCHADVSLPFSLHSTKLFQSNSCTKPWRGGGALQMLPLLNKLDADNSSGHTQVRWQTLIISVLHTAKLLRAACMVTLLGALTFSQVFAACVTARAYGVTLSADVCHGCTCVNAC